MSKWINECHTDPCQSGGTCEDLEDGYRLIKFRKSFLFTNLSGYFHGNSTEMTCHEEFLFKFSDNSQGFLNVNYGLSIIMSKVCQIILVMKT